MTFEHEPARDRGPKGQIRSAGLDDDSREPTPYRPRRAALALIAVGLPGVLSVLLVLPDIEGVPRLLLLVNPLLLLVLLAFIGAWAAPRAGLSSRIAARDGGLDVALLPPGWMRLLAIGAIAGLVIAGLDHATRPLWQPEAAGPPSLMEAWTPSALIVGVLYGGVVEEITMRWGLMSLFVLAAWKIGARRAAAPPPAAIWTGIVSAAIVFAAGHLPALAASGVSLETPLVLRTLVWNGALGLLFGWLFARRDLESAMLAHAGFHLGLIPWALVMMSG